MNCSFIFVFLKVEEIILTMRKQELEENASGFTA